MVPGFATSPAIFLLLACLAHAKECGPKGCESGASATGLLQKKQTHSSAHQIVMEDGAARDDFEQPAFENDKSAAGCPEGCKVEIQYLMDHDYALDGVCTSRAGDAAHCAGCSECGDQGGADAATDAPMEATDAPEAGMPCNHPFGGFVDHFVEVTVDNFLKRCPIDAPVVQADEHCGGGECLIDPDRATCCGHHGWQPDRGSVATVADAATDVPTEAPTDAPTGAPTDVRTGAPTDTPTETPTDTPTVAPTFAPTQHPCSDGSHGCDTANGICYENGINWTCGCNAGYSCSANCGETQGHTCTLTTQAPTVSPTVSPTASPTMSPTVYPTAAPTVSPTVNPTESPTGAPTEIVLYSADDEPANYLGWNADDVSTTEVQRFSTSCDKSDQMCLMRDLCDQLSGTTCEWQQYDPCGADGGSYRPKFANKKLAHLWQYGSPNCLCLHVITGGKCGPPRNKVFCTDECKDRMRELTGGSSCLQGVCHWQVE